MSENKAGAKPARNVLVNIQYIKDLSFENPTAPQSLIPSKEKPNINVSVDIKVNRIQENNFEVGLIINAEASTKERKLFVVELSYSGLFTINLTEEETEPALMVYCPNLLFPFARQIIGEATRQGGFPPLLIDPIDFGALYHRHKEQLAAGPANNP